MGGNGAAHRNRALSRFSRAGAQSIPARRVDLDRARDRGSCRGPRRVDTSSWRVRQEIRLAVLPAEHKQIAWPNNCPGLFFLATAASSRAKPSAIFSSGMCSKVEIARNAQSCGIFREARGKLFLDRNKRECLEAHCREKPRHVAA